MLRKLHVPPPNKNITRNMATFLHLVVAKCWKMFRVDKSVIFKNAKTARQRLENEIPEDEKNREEKIQKQLYQLKLQQLRYVGNIRYIGELFKVGILTMRHMKHVIKKLLLASDENSLKCLCQLLTTVGSKLDKSEAKNKMDVCFKILKEISETCKPKMKLLLKDLMDLRDNSWLPRTQCASPHSLDEVSNVFEKEHETEEDWDKEIQEAELRQLEEEDWDREIREVELRKLEEEDWDREIQEAEMRKLEEDWDKEIHVAQLRKLNLGISKVM